MFSFQEDLRRLEETSSYRFLTPYKKKSGRFQSSQKNFINFSSNDYLSLSTHAKLIKSSKKYAEKYGVGATASRLVSGDSLIFHECEKWICRFKECESALVFNSGYSANVGILPALADRKTVVFMDRLIHASLIDGIRISGATWLRYQHNDMSHLESLLKKNAKVEKKIIVTESVFSMNGDKSPLKAMHAMCEYYDAYLYVDEAHSSGVMGEKSKGLVYDNGLSNSKRVIGMSTFGKAMGSYGAYFFGKKLIKDWLINQARSFIFSTALPPAVIGANIAALKVLINNPNWGRALLSKANHFRANLIEKGIPLIEGDSQIISVLTGENNETLDCADFLKKKGFLCVGIRPPTVSKGKGRLRLAVNRGHKLKELDKLAKTLEQYFKGKGRKN